MYMKMYTTQFSHSLRTDDELHMFTDEINQLDAYLDYYSYDSDSKLVYNDGSSNTMILSFALNKLISEANSIKSAKNIYNQSDSHVYFVNYNSINGLITSITA